MDRVKWTAFALFVICVLAVAVLFNSQNPAESVVAIYQDGFLLGSGFVVGDGYIGTCNHVVRDGVEYRLVFKDGTEFTGVKAHGDYGLDLALVKGDFTGKTVLKFGKPEIGDEVYSIGHPTGEGWFVGFGVVSGISGAEAKTDVIMLPGSSGGPLIRGRLVVGVSQKIKGIVVIGTILPSGIGYAVRGDIAREYFMAAINITEAING